MRLVVGLGNPGARYEATRHNVGWWVLERLVARWGAIPAERTPGYRTWMAEVEGRTVCLMAPLTFMNLSGEAVADWRSRHPEVPLDGVMVVADDVYLPVGALRIRGSGSSGGHRGLESIERALQSREYARTRVGVGAARAEELKRHVLDIPEPEERAVLDETAGLAADAVVCWVRDGLVAAMNRFNRKERKEVSEP